MSVGIAFLCIGVLLFPIGIYSILDDYKELKKLDEDKKFWMVATELLLLYTGGTSPVFWILGMSLLLMAGGFILIFNFQ